MCVALGSGACVSIGGGEQHLDALDAIVGTVDVCVLSGHVAVLKRVRSCDVDDP